VAVKRLSVLLTLVCALNVAAGCARRDPLPSWNEGATKRAITSFVERATAHGSPGFVKPAERVAVFDNDGTLWSEQPTYVQRVFVVDRIRHLAPQHPEWKHAEPFKSVLAAAHDDASAATIAMTLPSKEMLELSAAASEGADVDEFDQFARDWVKSARHPKYHTPYTDLAYQPMLELLAYLRASGFRTFIVTGGGADFVRVLSEDCYGVEPERVLGNANELTLETRGGKPTLVKGPKLTSSLDGPGKPIAIRNQIGRRPVMAFGNSDGDLQMLQYAAAGDGARFVGVVHHTDAAREVAYDRDSKVGRLDKALDAATTEQWTVIDIKNDWKTIFRQGDRR
jgi:phosphoserine phosphatase